MVREVDNLFTGESLGEGGGKLGPATKLQKNLKGVSVKIL